MAIIYNNPGVSGNGKGISGGSQRVSSQQTSNQQANTVTNVPELSGSSESPRPLSSLSLSDSLPFILLRAAGSNPQLRASASQLLQRIQFGDKAGLQSFYGKRDLYEALGYQKTLTTNDYRARHERGGIAETIVECLPRATWKGKITLIEQESPNRESQFEADMENLLERLSIQSILFRADVLAGLGRYSIILIGTELGDGEDLSTPLSRNLSGPDSLLTLTPIPEDRAEVDQLVGELGDPSSISDPRFGLPEYYMVKLGTPRSTTFGVDVGSLSSILNQRVHWTRVIHVAEGLLENEIYGKPRLRAVWNLLDDLYKLTGAGSEAFWNLMSAPMAFDADPELEIDEIELQKFKEEIEDVYHRIRPHAFTRGVTPKPLSSNKTIAFRENVNTIIDLIAAVMRIPKRRLLGTERGQLASGQDDDNFNDTVAERRETFAEVVVKQLVDRFIEYRIISKPSRKDGKYEIIWGEEEELNELEKGSLTEKMANANKSQKEADGTVILTSDEIRDRVYGLDPLPKVEIEGKEEREEKESEKDKNIDDEEKVTPTPVVNSLAVNSGVM